MTKIFVHYWDGGGEELPAGGEASSGCGWPARAPSSARGPWSSTTTAGTTHQLLNRPQEGKWRQEEETKKRGKACKVYPDEVYSGSLPK